MASSSSDARDALSSALGGCCSSAVLCNDLFVNHRIETCCSSDEERRDAFLRHLLNGVCILQPNVPACKSFALRFTSTMHLSYDICTLLLAAYKEKRVSLNTFRICCACIDLETNGSNYGRDLSHKLHQRLTRWRPLYGCQHGVAMISLLESLGSGSLLELASLHNIRSDSTTSDKDLLRDIIIRHLILGDCQITNMALCASVQSVLSQSAEHSTRPDIRPLILDSVINLGVKKTLQRALRCVGVSHASTDSIASLRTALDDYRNSVFATGPANAEIAISGSQKKLCPALKDIANAWPQRISHVDKARIVHNFRSETSSKALKAVTCASCAEKVRAASISNQPVSELNLDLLRPQPSMFSIQTDCTPPLPFKEGPLSGLLIDPSGVHSEDGVLYLALCSLCRSSLARQKLPRFSLANLNVIGAVPPELQSLTLVEELIVSRCRAKACIVKLQDYNDNVDLPTVQRGMKGHIIVFPQHPENLPNVMPPEINDIISPICIIFCGSTVPTMQWLKEKAHPLVVRREVVLKALVWLRTHNHLYENVIIDEHRIAALPVDDVLDYHVECIEPSTAAQTLVSRYDISGSSQTDPPPDNTVTFESVLITDVDANSPSSQLKAAALRHAK